MATLSEAVSLTLDVLVAHLGVSFERHGGRRIDLPITRERLATLFAELGCCRGAEIGVERGEYAEMLCKASPVLLQLLAVDAWAAYPGYREHVTQTKLDDFFLSTSQRLKPYRVTIIRDFSVNAARLVPDRSLDFCYIDANHELSHVIADLSAWVPKVRPGGIVAGHDFRTSRGKAGAVFHVPYAIEAWTAAHDIRPWFVLTGDRSPSWMWVQS